MDHVTLRKWINLTCVTMGPDLGDDFSNLQGFTFTLTSTEHHSQIHILSQWILFPENHSFM